MPKHFSNGKARKSSNGMRSKSSLLWIFVSFGTTRYRSSFRRGHGCMCVLAFRAWSFCAKPIMYGALRTMQAIPPWRVISVYTYLDILLADIDCYEKQFFLGCKQMCILWTLWNRVIKPNNVTDTNDVVIDLKDDGDDACDIIVGLDESGMLTLCRVQRPLTPRPSMEEKNEIK